MGHAYVFKLPDPVRWFVALDVLPYILELANLMIVGTYHEERVGISVGIYDDRWAHRELMQDALSERLKARRLR